jgi:hypothetical protein
MYWANRLIFQKEKEKIQIEGDASTIVLKCQEMMQATQSK